MTPFEQAVQELEIFGFTLVDGVLARDEVKTLREALIRCEREVGTDHTHRGAARHVANAGSGLLPLHRPPARHAPA